MKGFRDLVAVVGVMPNVSAGGWIEVQGRWMVDREHGQQFKVDGFVRVLAAKGLDIVPAAPTGRAAKRVSETSGREAKTIYRLLEFDPATGAGSREAAGWRHLRYRRGIDGRFGAGASTDPRHSTLRAGHFRWRCEPIAFGRPRHGAGRPDRLGRATDLPMAEIVNIRKLMLPTLALCDEFDSPVPRAATGRGAGDSGRIREINANIIINGPILV